MTKDMQEYLRELSADFINLTLDYNTYEQLVGDISKIINSKQKQENKINRIKELLEVFNEKVGRKN